MTTLTLTSRPSHEEQADVLVVFLAKGEAAPRLLGDLPQETRAALDAAVAALRAKGKADETTWLPGAAGVAAPLVLLVGVGGAEEPSLEQFRRAAGTAGRALLGRSTAVVALPDGEAEVAGAIAEGMGYGAYRFAGHYGTKTTSREEAVGEVRLAGAGGDAQAELDRAARLVAGVALARDLVNMAPNELYPETFATIMTDRAPEGVHVTVHDEAALAELGAGGILGVGQGSEKPPAIVRLSYAPEGAKGKLAFVGKGITFDSGGLCIKPAGGMVTMKCDMGGAAAVAGAVFTIAELGLPVAVDGWLCLAENMPDAAAQRPGDVVTMADGSTCEIINTDAEGRLALADGLILACRENPDAVVDVATLTGAAIVALGLRTAAVLANDDEFQGEVTSAATEAGEAVWPMPIPEEISEALESTVADRKHAGNREGGTLFAAAYLREYVGSESDTPVPWAHIDIAGPAFHEAKAYGYTPKGGTGYGVRTLVALAESRS